MLHSNSLVVHYYSYNLPFFWTTSEILVEGLSDPLLWLLAALI